ncbi:MAG TPA: AlpA family phage regulatory protein [Albidovulum sp.]|uniref:helix-turn-helix transcriptional regulator n=1 Tax=Albidovulum sp. TaxID=1872424 RepID=UPI002C8402F4|nr:AlpA family phage regulatory protein [Albidovulum sp.]
MSAATNPDLIFINVAQVAGRYGISVDTVWRWSRSGDLPRPLRIGPNITRWRLADLIAHENTFTSAFAFSFRWAV